jgi:hypothetical protein
MPTCAIDYAWQVGAIVAGLIAIAIMIIFNPKRG